MVSRLHALLAALATQETSKDKNKVKDYKVQLSLLIQMAVVTAYRYTLHPWDLVDLLRSYYGLEIPISLIRRTVQSMTAKQVQIEQNGNKFIFNTRIAAAFTKPIKAYLLLSFRCNEMLGNLHFHIASLRDKKVVDEEK